MLQNDFFKQRYITFNATIPGQDRIYPNTHLCRTFFAGYMRICRKSFFAKMTCSLFYIITQLFIQIMCKNQLIQVNRLQEIMNNEDLHLVLIHPPEEVRRLYLCR